MSTPAMSSKPPSQSNNILAMQCNPGKDFLLQLKDKRVKKLRALPTWFMLSYNFSAAY